MRLAATLSVVGLAENALSLSDPQDDRNGIQHTAESIHQELVFNATRKRVYEALTDEQKFAQVTDFIMKGAAAEISRDVGAAFSIFGGVIIGRHIELVPY